MTDLYDRFLGKFISCFSWFLSFDCYDKITWLSFFFLIHQLFQKDELKYWVIVSFMNDRIYSLAIINFLFVNIYKQMSFFYHFFFGNIQEGERLEITDRVRIRLIFVSFTLIIFYLSKDELSFIFYVSTIITAWCIIWLTCFVSLRFVNTISKFLSIFSI